MHVKEDLKIKISANIVDFTLEILTTAWSERVQRHNQKEMTHAINNSLVKIPSRDFQFIHFLSPFSLG